MISKWNAINAKFRTESQNSSPGWDHSNFCIKCFSWSFLFSCSQSAPRLKTNSQVTCATFWPTVLIWRTPPWTSMDIKSMAALGRRPTETAGVSILSGEKKSIVRFEGFLLVHQTVHSFILFLVFRQMGIYSKGYRYPDHSRSTLGLLGHVCQRGSGRMWRSSQKCRGENSASISHFRTHSRRY